MTRVAVVGCGIMGSGITFVARAAGFPVIAVEPSDELVAAARKRVDRQETQARKRDADLSELAAYELTTDLAEAVGGAGIVVEAVPEDLELKRAVFAELGAAAGGDTVVASNTSGLSIEDLAAASGRSSQVLGLHFFNPVPAMRLVEVVRAPGTSDDTVARGIDFARTLGKETVEVRDMPGFVTTRLGTVLMCEAIRAYEQGVASVEHVDTAMKLGYNHPMGPLELADRIGLDTVLFVLDDLREAYGDAFSPPPLLRRMVDEGKLGRKSGAGFYDY
ncbi:MAG TPA: 3-hydroxyacyl-CoA dehydrogenase family protein [Acidimicrobiia bacterium]|nr:3-hydroxyacyl-CoA dehydrogenase family protein [Acidimicrobiia bacterium]